jgi:tripartite-type tricarboxylate transporter receptor subunit TctC
MAEKAIAVEDALEIDRPPCRRPRHPSLRRRGPRSVQSRQTRAESGITGQDAYTLTGLLAPAGTPKEIISLLHQEIVKIVAMPDVQQRLGDLGFEILASTPDEFAVRIKTEMEKWGKVIRDAKIKVEGAH